MGKAKLTYQEKYKKGNVVNKKRDTSFNNRKY